MAINTNNNHRVGSIKNRSQCYNPNNKQFIKRDENGRFIGSKATPYKGVKKEDTAKNAVKKIDK